MAYRSTDSVKNFIPSSTTHTEFVVELFSELIRIIPTRMPRFGIVSALFLRACLFEKRKGEKNTKEKEIIDSNHHEWILRLNFCGMNSPPSIHMQTFP
jgi:hypothetical protein